MLQRQKISFNFGTTPRTFNVVISMILIRNLLKKRSAEFYLEFQWLNHHQQLEDVRSQPRLDAVQIIISGIGYIWPKEMQQVGIWLKMELEL